MGPTRVPLLFGTMTMGEQGKNGVRNSQLSECQEILDVFFSHGHNEIDTARVYADGTTEVYLSKLDLKGSKIDTKVYPVNPGVHAPQVLRATFKESLKALNRDKVRTLYLHAPDRSVPFEETVQEVDRLHKEDLFEVFGLSNFAAWEVAEVVGICKAKNYVLPGIYQAMYNAITREIEGELVPCLRKYGIRLMVYNPLAGGLFAGKVSSAEPSSGRGTRFDGDSRMAVMYRGRYVNKGYLEALEYLKTVADKHNITLIEMALRWCQHHSVLGPDDGVILGASSSAQLKTNCEDSAKSPLNDDVVRALDHARELVGFSVAPYWR